MGLLHTAYKTYEVHGSKAGVTESGKETLTPVSHMLQKADIEVTITQRGEFISASMIDKADALTVIPVTMDSASRSGKYPPPHALCDKIAYLCPRGDGKAHNDFMQQLREWNESEFSHPKVSAVYAYLCGGTIFSDLLAAGVITEQKCDGFVRWRIVSDDPDNVTACWQDPSLLQAYTSYYAGVVGAGERDICLISGREDAVCTKHPKGTVAKNFNSKLLSANDDKEFTYRGRFTDPQQAYCVGYDASQKAHNALRWVVANAGILAGERTFACWNPDDCSLDLTHGVFAGFRQGEPEFAGYKEELRKTIGGYRNALKPTDDVVICALDAATPGRLSVTYYNELKGSDFIDRIERWYSSFCFFHNKFGLTSPSLRSVVECAFGCERDGRIECDNKLLGGRVQQLMHCVVDGSPLPFEVVRALVNKAGNPLAYSESCRSRMFDTACCAVRKYRNDRSKKEVYQLSLDVNSNDRSYLFGRLLAIADYVEKLNYEKDEKRDTNAIRMMSVFRQRPLHTWNILEERLRPYLSRLHPGTKVKYNKMMAEFVDRLPNDDSRDRPLEDTFILGFRSQQNALYTKNDNKEKENEENE